MPDLVQTDPNYLCTVLRPGLKKKLLDSLESNLKTCHKLSKELGLEFEEPDSRLVLLKLEHATKQEATRLRELKEARLVEVSRLRRADEDLCQRLGVDPYYISSSGVPNEYQVEGLRDHIRYKLVGLFGRNAEGGVR